MLMSLGGVANAATMAEDNNMEIIALENQSNLLFDELMTCYADKLNANNETDISIYETRIQEIENELELLGVEKLSTAEVQEIASEDVVSTCVSKPADSGGKLLALMTEALYLAKQECGALRLYERK